MKRLMRSAVTNCEKHSSPAAVHRPSEREMSGAKEPEAKDKVVFYHHWCKKCGICTAFCPKDALAYDDEGHPYLKDSEACKSCGQCEVLCPDLAITVPARHKE